MSHYKLFDTAIGRCGIAWGEHGLLCVQLPEPSDPATRARLLRQVPAARESACAPPPDMQCAIDAIASLLRGESSDLGGIVLDMGDVPAFHRRVYEIARGIEPGTTWTYGEVAAKLGEPGAARAVGQALGRNPFAIVVPCHRVLAAGGKMGGFSASGGALTKQRLLAIEAAGVTPSLFDA